MKWINVSFHMNSLSAIFILMKSFLLNYVIIWDFLFIWFLFFFFNFILTHIQNSNTKVNNDLQFNNNCVLELFFKFIPSNVQFNLRDGIHLIKSFCSYISLNASKSKYSWELWIRFVKCEYELRKLTHSDRKLLFEFPIWIKYCWKHSRTKEFFIGKSCSFLRFRKLQVGVVYILRKILIWFNLIRQ